MPLNVPYTVEVTPLRRHTDFGEVGWWPLPPIQVCYALSPPQPVMSEVSGRYTQDGQLFADRGVDLKDGDRVPLPEGDFGVIGDAQWDFVHPMTGFDFGKVVFEIRRGG